MNGDVVDKYDALLHHFFQMTQAQRIGYVPANAGEHDFQRTVEPNEYLAQGAVDRTYTEIKHGLDCRLRFLQQNRAIGVDLQRYRVNIQPAPILVIQHSAVSAFNLCSGDSTCVEPPGSWHEVPEFPF